MEKSNQKTTTNYLDRINEIIDALPGGFDYDWSMAWGDAQEMTTGEGDWETIADEEAREAAREYEEAVMSDSRAACELEEEAAELLAKGQLSAAMEKIVEAADLEKKYGDCPTYHSVLGLLRGASRPQYSARDIADELDRLCPSQVDATVSGNGGRTAGHSGRDDRDDIAHIGWFCAGGNAGNPVMSILPVDIDELWDRLADLPDGALDVGGLKDLAAGLLIEWHI